MPERKQMITVIGPKDHLHHPVDFKKMAANNEYSSIISRCYVSHCRNIFWACLYYAYFLRNDANMPNKMWSISVSKSRI